MHNPTPLTSYKRRKWYFFAFVLIFLVGFPIAIFFSLGYRVTKDFRIVATGGIALHEVPDDADVFINYKQVKSPNIFRRSFFVSDLIPGTYLVVVARKDHWSWAKKLEVQEKQVTSASVFSLPQKTNARAIPEYIAEGEEKSGFQFFSQGTSSKRLNEKYSEVKELFKNPRSDEDGEPIVYRSVSLEGLKNTISVSWKGNTQVTPDFFCVSTCADTVVVYQSSEIPRGYGFYPNREDVVLVLRKDGLFAYEIDQRVEQNIQPLYLGEKLDFRVLGNDIYVKDGESYFEILP